MATHEALKKDATARATKNLCVCSTAEYEVTGTALVGIFKWSEQYPLLCSACADVHGVHPPHVLNFVTSSPLRSSITKV